MQRELNYVSQRCSSELGYSSGGKLLWAHDCNSVLSLKNNCSIINF